MSIVPAESEEKPCLHCAFVDLIDEFFRQHNTGDGEPEIDTNEVLEAIAKTVAEFTSGQDSAERQKFIERLMHQIMEYDTEFRRENESGSIARH